MVGVSKLTAGRIEHEGRILVTIVGLNVRDEVVFTTTLVRETDRARWWDHEPHEYDGA